MAINRENVKKYLNDFDFHKIFIEEMLWNRHPAKPETLQIGDKKFQLSFIAEQAGFTACTIEDQETGKIPDKTTQLKTDTQIRKISHEHLIIFVDRRKTQAVWIWVKREKGLSPATRTHTYHKGQSGDSLIQKLEQLAFEFSELDVSGETLISTVTKKAKKAFDVEKVTKKFYDEFKIKHADFLKFIDGIDNLDDQRWYASVMLNRLMFIYFIQKKGFIDSNINYLQDKLKEFHKNKKDTFYSIFLTTLFFEGFAREEKDRKQEINRMLGKIPYLNGGLFMPHQIEEMYGENIDIPDKAFEKLFDFFDQYRWNLDERPTRDDREINPDVLGYIFEKYINQKQMGAYYTKEDITDYISKNTIIPFLIDKQRPKDLEPFPMEDVDRYIYDAVKKGVEHKLPDYIECGIKSVPKRTRWNEPADEEYALPTEIWREVVARRQRYDQIHEDFRTGKISNINDLITYNLDITKFAQDWVAGIEEPSALNYFYFENLKKISVLDPTCGSGAFLFAALNILESLYEICLDRMEEFSDQNHPKFKADYAKNFKTELKRINDHPNRKYFVYKEVIINNLFGVDIMDEAVEICKLRLFLKLVAQVEDVKDIEPLPDIDFNIRAGNTLIGYTSLDEINKAKVETMDFGIDVLGKVKEASRELRNFRELQSKIGISARDMSDAKEKVKAKFKIANEALDKDLAQIDYKIDISNAKKFIKWKKSHKPFHWYVDFYQIMEESGFDVIIGNPPYVEYSKVKAEYEIKGYKTEGCGNLYALIFERSINILTDLGRLSLIVPISSISTPRMTNLMSLLNNNCILWHVANFAVRPGKLFIGADMNLTVHACKKFISSTQCEIFSTVYQRWYNSFRSELFYTIKYIETQLHDEMSSIPKISYFEESSVLNKLLKFPSITQYLTLKPATTIYYHSGGRYFRKCTLNKLTNEYKDLIVPEVYRLNIVALLSSSLYYWFWLCESDAYHVTSPDISKFSVSEPLLKDSDLKKLGNDYLKDIWKNSKVIERSRKDKSVQNEINFNIGLSKPIIDKIDRVLAKYYGFTDEELDFIINYDIKYRMGKTSNEENEE
jgi:hypothetical protein